MIKRIAVFTSGGDAPGMNAAVRSVTRTALDRGLEVFAIYEGYQGLIDGGDRIQQLSWDSVSGILQRGGTVIGTARCQEFRTREGRLTAARNLVECGIDGLVVIGGDGSLTAANIFRQEWPDLIEELLETERISSEEAEAHPHLFIVGLVGSIDNDFCGTDMTIGADTALHRITEAVDAITSTAASHQRTFVIKVMGRNCGYLALMGALSCGADWVLIPENPPDVEDWEQVMAQRLKAGRETGRRDNIVILAEGARDRNGERIGSSDVRRALEERINEEVRVTVLGHVQRGGRPSAFDRNLGTMLGYAAVNAILEAKPEDDPLQIGIKGNRVAASSLMKCIHDTQDVTEAVSAGDYKKAMALRSASFTDAFRTLRVMVRALPHPPTPGQDRYRIAVLNAGAPAPGMNTATRAITRLGLDRGHIVLGVKNGFEGFAKNEIRALDWMGTNLWASMGGSELGTSRVVPGGSDLYAIARTIEDNQIDGLIVVGGWNAYEASYKLYTERPNYPAFNIPTICLPASIDNNLPGSELSIGADTALNNIVEAVDKIKQSAVATRRCFIVEVMGHWCGYLALLSGMATGAERVYMHEEGVTLNDLQTDVASLIRGFKRGRRLGLIIRNERANEVYTTDFTCALFEEEGRDLFDVRPAILGHQQQGGNPSPFDRIQATRFGRLCLGFLIDEIGKGSTRSSFLGSQRGEIKYHEMRDFLRMVDERHQRPLEQWWLDLREIAQVMATSEPGEV